MFRINFTVKCKQLESFKNINMQKGTSLSKQNRNFMYVNETQWYYDLSIVDNQFMAYEL